VQSYGLLVLGHVPLERWCEVNADWLKMVQQYEREIAELRLERDNAVRRADRAEQSVRGLLTPEQFLKNARLFGYEFEDITTIGRMLAEWRAAGGTPGMLDWYREERYGAS